MKQVLVTDSLFIFPEHEQQLRNAGFDVVRLNKPEATEEELREAVKGKIGYILGGVEKVTDAVINSADSLKAVVFTGIGYKSFIPGWKLATEKGIAIGNTPDGPTQAVAEWSLAAALAMNRGLFELGSPEGKTFLTTPGIAGQTVGIIALGRIGGRIAELLQPFKPAKSLYYSTHRHPDKEKQLGLQFTEMDKLVSQSDIVFLCVPGDEVEDKFFNVDYIANMKQNALLVSFADSHIIDVDALYNALSSGKVRAISDYPMGGRFQAFPKSTFYSFKGSNAFNAQASLKYTSDKATEVLINLLTTGQDNNRVN